MRYIIFILTILLTLSACGSTTTDADMVFTRASDELLEEAAPETTGSVPETAVSAPFGFETGGVRLIPGQAFDSALLPPAAAVCEVPSCAIEGTDTVYTYDTFEVTVVNNGSSPYIASIYLLTPDALTPEGLALGDSAAKADQCYGSDFQTDGTGRIYTRQQTALSIIVQNDVVVSIEYLTA